MNLGGPGGGGEKRRGSENDRDWKKVSPSSPSVLARLDPLPFTGYFTPHFCRVSTSLISPSNLGGPRSDKSIC